MDPTDPRRATWTRSQERFEGTWTKSQTLRWTRSRATWTVGMHRGTLKEFGERLKNGACQKPHPTVDDPKGNKMSLASRGHINHPANMQGAVFRKKQHRHASSPSAASLRAAKHDVCSRMEPYASYFLHELCVSRYLSRLYSRCLSHDALEIVD